MTCHVCGTKPREFWMFGGGYWKRLSTDRLCPSCFHWALWILAVQS